MVDGRAQAQQQPLIQGHPQLQVDPAVQAFQNLRVELANITQALTAQGISSIVNKFDGNPKNFCEWIKSIEKYAVLVNADEDRKKLIAYQSSGGAVSGSYMGSNESAVGSQILWFHRQSDGSVTFKASWAKSRGEYSKLHWKNSVSSGRSLG